MNRLPIATCLAALTLIARLAGPVPALADTSTVVAPGDDLLRIALRYGTSVNALVQANGLVSADQIYAGQRLLVPGEASAGTPAVSVTGDPASARNIPSASVPAFEPTGYQIKPGDTLLRIALRHGATVHALVAVNDLASPYDIYTGQLINIPGRTTGVVGAGASLGGVITNVIGGNADAGRGTGSPSDMDAGAPTRSVAPVSPGRSEASWARGQTGRVIRVSLSTQRLTALEDGVPIRSFVVSTGSPYTPTPMGHFKISSRYASQTMYGPGYVLPGVPYVQYFTGGYAIHGAYWHNSFGTPVTHGCVNLTTGDAEWMWRWSSLGTDVVIGW